MRVLCNGKIGLAKLTGLLFFSFLLSSCSGGGDKEEIASLKESINVLQKELTKTQDVIEIQKIMARYEAIHNETDMVKTYMLFADRKDTTFTVTADHIEGYDNIKSYFERMTGQMGGSGKRTGTSFEHPLSTPIIEVAADGQTAKATWASFGEETMPAMGGDPGGASGGPPGGQGGAPGSAPGGQGGAPPQGGMPSGTGGDQGGAGGPPGSTGDAPMGMPGGAPGGQGVASGDDSGENLIAMWCYGKYANDFIKIDGKWYIWHLQWIRFFRTPFDTSWVDQPIEEIYGQFYQNGQIIEKEGTYFKPYYTGKISESIPAAPKPYETWTEEEEGWWLNDTVEP